MDFKIIRLPLVDVRLRDGKDIKTSLKRPRQPLWLEKAIKAQKKETKTLPPRRV